MSSFRLVRLAADRRRIRLDEGAGVSADRRPRGEPAQLHWQPGIRVGKLRTLALQLYPQFTQRGAGDVVPSSRLADRLKKVLVHEACEITRCGTFLDSGAMHVRRSPDPKAKGGVEERITDALRQPVLADDRVELLPDLLASSNRRRTVCACMWCARRLNLTHRCASLPGCQLPPPAAASTR